MREQFATKSDHEIGADHHAVMTLVTLEKVKTLQGKNYLAVLEYIADVVEAYHDSKVFGGREIFASEFFASLSGIVEARPAKTMKLEDAQTPRDLINYALGELQKPKWPGKEFCSKADVLILNLQQPAAAPVVPKPN